METDGRYRRSGGQTLRQSPGSPPRVLLALSAGGTRDSLLTHGIRHRGWDVTSVVMLCKTWPFSYRLQLALVTPVAVLGRPTRQEVKETSCQIPARDRKVVSAPTASRTPRPSGPTGRKRLNVAGDPGTPEADPSSGETTALPGPPLADEAEAGALVTPSWPPDPRGVREPMKTVSGRYTAARCHTAAAARRETSASEGHTGGAQRADRLSRTGPPVSDGSEPDLSRL